MKNLQCKKFTLVELLAAMAVFSVLLLVSMQLFSGAQQLWVRSEQKSNAFSDARTAMEFVAVRLQTVVYYDSMPFGMDKDEIFFATAMPMENRDAEYYLRFLKFELDDSTEKGLLVMKTYSGKENARSFIKHFPPYKKDTDIETAWDNVKTKFGKNISSMTVESENILYKDGEDVEAIVVAENVTDFKIHGHFATKDGTGWKLTAQKDIGDTFKDGSFIIAPPYLAEVEISIIDNKEAYQRWRKASDTAKKDIFAEYGYTFRRAVVLGQRSEK